MRNSGQQDPERRRLQRGPLPFPAKKNLTGKGEWELGQSLGSPLPGVCPANRAGELLEINWRKLQILYLTESGVS